MPHTYIEPANCRLDKSAAAGTSGASCLEFCLDEFPGCDLCPYTDREQPISRSAEDPMKSAVLRGWIRGLSPISK